MFSYKPLPMQMCCIQAAVAPKKATAIGAAKPAMTRVGAAKKAAGSGAIDAGPADNDDAALAGGTLSDSELKEKMQGLLGDVIYNGLLV